MRFDTEEWADFFDEAGDTLFVSVGEDKFFLARSDSPQLLVTRFDFDGNQLTPIKGETEKVKITKAFVSRVHDYYRVKYRFHNVDYCIKNLNLPEYFPAVRNIYAADKKLYVVTFKKIAGQTEVLVFDTDGKSLSKVLLPVREKNPEFLSPTGFKNNRMYQLVENTETENWELFVTPIK